MLETVNATTPPLIAGGVLVALGLLHLHSSRTSPPDRYADCGWTHRSLKIFLLACDRLRHRSRRALQPRLLSWFGFKLHLALRCARFFRIPHDPSPENSADGSPPPGTTAPRPPDPDPLAQHLRVRLAEVGARQRQTAHSPRVWWALELQRRGLRVRQFLLASRYYRFRPQRIGSFVGFAEMLDDAGRRITHPDCGTQHMRIGLEEWAVWIPLLSSETLHHEMIHGAQQADAQWLTRHQRLTRFGRRLSSGLRAEIHACLFGSPLITFLALWSLHLIVWPALSDFATFIWHQAWQGATLSLNWKGLA